MPCWYSNNNNNNKTILQDFTMKYIFTGLNSVGFPSPKWPPMQGDKSMASRPGDRDIRRTDQQTALLNTVPREGDWNGCLSWGIEKAKRSERNDGIPAENLG